MDKEVTLSVIIVTYNSQDEISPCLNSIFTGEKKLSLEVIVVDNHSQDETVAKVKKFFSQVKIIPLSQNVGYSRAINLGVARSYGKHLLILNPDTKILNEALTKMVNYLKDNPQVGVLGPRLYDNDKKELQPSGVGTLDFPAAFFALSFLDKIWPQNPFSKRYWYRGWPRDSLREVGSVSGAAMMIPKVVFEKLNGFDQNFFLYFEEEDFCRRVKEAGFQIVFYPQAEIIHYREKSIAKVNKKQINKIFRQSRYYFFRKHFGPVKGVLAECFLRTFENASQLLGKIR